MEVELGLTQLQSSRHSAGGEFRILLKLLLPCGRVLPLQEWVAVGLVVSGAGDVAYSGVQKVSLYEPPKHCREIPQPRQYYLSSLHHKHWVMVMRR